MPTLEGSATKPTGDLTVPTVGSDTDSWGDLLNDTTFQTIADYFEWLATNLPDGDLVGTSDLQNLANKTFSTNTNVYTFEWVRATDTIDGGGSSLTWGTAHHILNISADDTVTFASVPTSGQYGYLHLEIVQDATGGHDITWPAAVEWVSGEAPDLSETDPNEVVFVQLWTRDGGTTVYGTHNKPSRINYQTGTSYTIQPTDDGKTVRCTNSSAVTVNVDTEANMGFIPNGFIVAIRAWGTGAVTINAETGVTIQSPGGLTELDGQYASAALEYQGSNVWALDGRLA